MSPLPEEGKKTLPYIAAEHGSMRVLSFLFRQMQMENISFHEHFHDRSLLYPLFERGNMEAINKIAEMFPAYDLANAPLDSQGTMPAHVAARMGKKNVLQWLATKEANFNSQDKKGCTPLYYAVRFGEESTVAILLEHRIRIRGKELYAAAIQQNRNILEQLMKKNPPPSKESLNFALCLAIFRHQTQACLRLHQQGASFFALTPKGWTPTLYASYSGQQDILEIILNEGIRDQRCFKKENAMLLACKEGHSGCVELLLQKDFNQPGKDLEKFLTKNTNIPKILKGERRAANQEVSSLFEALKTGNVDMALNTLNALPPLESISVKFQGKYIWGPPLLVAIRFCQDQEMKITLLKRSPGFPPNVNPVDHEGNTLAHLLVKAGIPPFDHVPVDFKVRNYAGQTLLHQGASQDNFSLLKELLKKAPPGAIEEEDLEGKTPIFYAIEHKKENNLPLLLHAGANLDHCTHQLFTPLLTACLAGSLDLVKQLLDFGADPNQKGTSRLSPLALAILEKQDEIALYLVTHGAKVSTLREEQDHLAHAAASVGNNSLLRLLDAKGVSLDFEDERGMQPIHYAALEGQTSSLETIVHLQGELLDVPVGEGEAKTKKEKIFAEKFTGATPLLLAAASNNSEVVQSLLNHHANPEARTQQKEGILTLAAESNASQSIFTRLEPLKISVELGNITSAIIGAILNDNPDRMISLYRRGRLSIDTDLKESQTGLHVASSFGALNCTAWLLQNGADPLLENPFRENAFALAQVPLFARAISSSF